MYVSPKRLSQLVISCHSYSHVGDITVPGVRLAILNDELESNVFCMWLTGVRFNIQAMLSMASALGDLMNFMVSDANEMSVALAQKVCFRMVRVEDDVSLSFVFASVEAK